MTYQDIRGIKDFDNKTVIAIKAPPETKLEVPDPKEVRIDHLNSEEFSKNLFSASSIFKFPVEGCL